MISKELLKEYAVKDESCEARMAGVRCAMCDFADAAQELLDRRERDAFPDNQRLCIGFDSGCDGNLEGVEHIESCPAYAADRKLRSYLYAPEADNEVR